MGNGGSSFGKEVHWVSIALIKCDTAEPDMLPFLFYALFILFKNLEPTLPIMQLCH